MIERDEISSIERQMRELSDSTVGSERERAELERAVAEAKAALEQAKTELPIAERAAKERRSAQVDAVRGRAELERRLADLVEAEALARSRRQQAEQRAQGFKAAAAFSGMARAEAEAAGDSIRADRERLVEERALREGSTADARAAEELAEETRIGKLRLEVAGHVKAEREIESAIASEREDYENRVAALRAKIERASMELHEAEANLARTDADRDRLSVERTQVDERLREVSNRARSEIEARIKELRAAEANLARERAEQEQLLATLIDNEKRVQKERKAAERAEAKRLEAEQAALKAQHEREAAEAVAAALAEAQAEANAAVAAREAEKSAAAQAETKTHSSNGKSKHADAPVRSSSGALLDFSTLGDYSDEAIQAEVDAQIDSKPVKIDPNASAELTDSYAINETDSEAVANYKRALAAGAANRDSSGVDMDEQLIPGFKSFIGNIFTRAKPARAEEVEIPVEEPPESSSIADRIARDFGLLGGD
jgi:SWI/SNF-related matrix-associated actin-dependent regulator 1 of chromatin subfamily A